MSSAQPVKLTNLDRAGSITGLGRARLVPSGPFATSTPLNEHDKPKGQYPM